MSILTVYPRYFAVLISSLGKNKCQSPDQLCPLSFALNNSM